MRFLACCAIASGLIAAPVGATKIITTYTGVIGDIHGTTPLFGADVTYGTAYSLVYSFDDADPAATVAETSTSRTLSGAGVVTAALTINGVTLNISGSNSSAARTDDARPESGRLFDLTGNSSDEYGFVEGLYYHSVSAQSFVASYLTDFNSDLSFGGGITYTPAGADSYQNSVHFNHFNYVTNTYEQNLYLNLAPGTVTREVLVETPAGVPEPRSWAMLILGFGLVGGAVRRTAAPVRQAAIG